MKEQKKYYWLKLNSDFFDDETIKYIEEQENGIKYSNFYLKLCLKSLKTEGKLIRLVGETLIPYDIASLSKLTVVDVDTVRCAMALFEKIGLIKILDTGEIYLSQIDELIGSETDKAQIMRRIRAEKKLIGNNVTELLPNCYTEIEKEKEIDKEKVLDADSRVSEIIKCYEENIGMITPAAAETILSYLNDFNEHKIIIEAIKKATLANKRSANYINGILKSWKAKGYKVLADLQNENRQVSNCSEMSTEDRAKAIEEMMKNGAK